MKKLFLMSLPLFIVYSSNAMAEPKSGFGINIGGTANYMASIYTVASATNALNSTYNYKSSGATFGMDYQILFPKNLTLNPFISLSSESTDLAGQSGSIMGHSILGLQGRQWMGDVFIGVHGALYTESLNNSTGSSSASETGSGVGLAVGWEPSGSRFSIALQGDSAQFKYSNQDVKLTGAHLIVGYRWK